MILATSSVVIIVILAILLLLIILAASSIRIVPQANAFVIERLGSYHMTWSTGLHFLVPFIYRISEKVSLKEQVIDFEPQPVITKDNVTMQIDTVIFFQVTDPKAYTYGVDDPIAALEKLTATTLRNIIGDIDLDSTLTSRDHINSKMRIILDEATDKWGIKVSRVELKNILPPLDIRNAMEKQMRAERERREVVLLAEGEKAAKILKAEGFKDAEVLRAEGEALAILKVQEATAKGIELIRKAGADQTVLTLKALEALKDLANGQATKIIIPSEIQGLAGLATSLSEIVKTDIKAKPETKKETKK
ncbi:MAG: SPFH domain-containing protein [Bacilli bacterium]|jgi:regulator of protease activity HflC (stomatin/prohibitin superfamily)